MSRYVGTWYTQELDATNKWSGKGTDCATKEYALNDEGHYDMYMRSLYTTGNEWVEAGYRGYEAGLYDCETGTCMM